MRPAGGMVQFHASDRGVHPSYRTFGVRSPGRVVRSNMSTALQRPHVLIVSDDADLSQFLGEGLIYAGFWTSVIASALQVMEVFRLRSFDAIVVDAALGGIGALELIRRLRGRSRRGNALARTDIPILIVAGAPEEATAEISAEDVFDIVTAPIEIGRLAERVTEAVTLWRAAHPERPWADESALRSE
jgi:DNA-binding response OmpR family regulator